MNYANHGTARVAIVACPHLVGNRLALLSTKGEYSWALRDYIGGVMLRSGDSPFTLTQVEADVAHSATPPYRSVNRKKEWANELEHASKRHFGSRYDSATPPLQSIGTWKKL